MFRVALATFPTLCGWFPRRHVVRFHPFQCLRAVQVHYHHIRPAWGWLHPIRLMTRVGTGLGVLLRYSEPLSGRELPLSSRSVLQARILSRQQSLRQNTRSSLCGWNWFANRSASQTRILIFLFSLISPPGAHLSQGILAPRSTIIRKEVLAKVIDGGWPLIGPLAQGEVHVYRIFRKTPNEADGCTRIRVSQAGVVNDTTQY